MQLLVPSVHDFFVIKFGRIVLEVFIFKFVLFQTPFPISNYRLLQMGTRNKTPPEALLL